MMQSKRNILSACTGNINNTCALCARYHPGLAPLHHHHQRAGWRRSVADVDTSTPAQASRSRLCKQYQTTGTSAYQLDVCPYVTEWRASRMLGWEMCVCEFVFTFRLYCCVRQCTHTQTPPLSIFRCQILPNACAHAKP